MNHLLWKRYLPRPPFSISKSQIPPKSYPSATGASFCRQPPQLATPPPPTPTNTPNPVSLRMSSQLQVSKETSVKQFDFIKEDPGILVGSKSIDVLVLVEIAKPINSDIDLDSEDWDPDTELRYWVCILSIYDDTNKRLHKEPQKHSLDNRNSPVSIFDRSPSLRRSPQICNWFLWSKYIYDTIRRDGRGPVYEEPFSNPGSRILNFPHTMLPVPWISGTDCWIAWLTRILDIWVITM